MTFTYTGDPAASEVETVRFHYQDTDSTRAILSDEEIQFQIDTYSTGDNLLYVASLCAEAAAAKYAGEVNVSGDGISVDTGSLAERYKALAKTLRAQYRRGISGGGPDVGGVDAMPTLDPSVKPTDFGSGMHDNPWAGNQAGGNGPAYYPFEPDGTA